MFLMIYFRTDSEALHLALSPDGFNWRALNKNRAVFVSQLGQKTLRDPFVLRGQDGHFHLLATNGWKSDHIFHAVSPDLIEWREQKLLPVMASVAGTRNCWAPEALWDGAASLYRVFWSSTTPQSGGQSDAHGYNHRIWSVSTPDFREFSGPELFFDPGYNVIDATIAARKEGGFLMAFKDERGNNTRDTPFKAIRTASAPTALGPWTIRQEFVSPRLTEGPILFRVQERWLLLFDHFLDGHFGGVSSENGHEWTDVSPRLRFPEGPRHASVLEISDHEAALLEERFGY